MSFKNTIINHVKNIPGWKTNRKLLAFAVDDYGNIRLSSIGAKEKLKAKGVTLKGRFDNLDSLDTKEDYEQLFTVLQSVKDSVGKPAIFTTYAMAANVNFASSLEQERFVPENLDISYERLAQEDPINYSGAFGLLKEGIANGLILPQFHGREHLNVQTFNSHLDDQNFVLIFNLELNSMAGVPNHKDLPKVRFSEAFSFWKKEEIENHKTIIKDGLFRFEKVYGFQPITFTPPSMLLHPDLYPFVESLGINAIDKPRVHQVHLGEGSYQKEKNTLGIQKGQKHVTIVRNCMFEPNSRNIDWVNFTLDQIKAAFFWGKPAIISSHRVNFCGHIDPENRRKGLETLQSLLKKIIKTWPDVEFVSTGDLADLIMNGK